MKQYIKRIVLKMLKKLVFTEFAKMDNRICELESKAGINPDSEEIWRKALAEMNANGIVIASIKENKLIFEPAGAPEKQTNKVMPGQLEVGKWYKRKQGCMFLFNGHSDKDGDPNGYGFIEGTNWINDGETGWGLSKGDTWKEATHEEVSAALIKEAKRRGYKKGVKITSLGLIKDVHDLESNEFIFDLTLNVLFCLDDTRNGGPNLFQKGQWAEVIEQPKEIDWNVPGQLVINEKNYVWLTSGEHEGRNFEATYMRHGDGAAYKIGQRSRDCVKNMFKPYTGPAITLSNG